ncbi:MAG: 3-phosphoshikimate 1-carboxyvinyltransferase [bacterium]
MSEISIIPNTCLSGQINVPGDKFISQVATILAALSQGKTPIKGFFMHEDCLNTLHALKTLGLRIERYNPDLVIIHGEGLGSLQEPCSAINMGKSISGMQLLIGLLATQPFFSVLTGSQSLCENSINKFIIPFLQCGATIIGRQNNAFPPLAIKGGLRQPIRYAVHEFDIYLKSAILLAGLAIDGVSEVAESAILYDHVERMIQLFNGEIHKENNTLSLTGGRELSATDIIIPGDFSLAAYFIGAVLITKRSYLLIRNVCVNPTRTKLITILKNMGAKIELKNQREISGEPVCDIYTQSSALKAIVIEEEILYQMINEILIFCLIATQAKGNTIIKGLANLPYTYAHRITSLLEALKRFGGEIEQEEGTIVIHGGRELTGMHFNCHNNNHLGMTISIAGLIARGKTTIENNEYIERIYPGFLNTLSSLS